MSDQYGTPPGPTPPGHQPPPNWGNAYPPQQPPSGYPLYPQQPPNHPQATTAMVLGIVGLTGFAICVTFLVAPVAWILGHKAVKEIDASAGQYGGRSEAKAGMIMGIVGTVLLALALAGIALIVGIGVSGGFDDSSGYDYDYDYSSLSGILP